MSDPTNSTMSTNSTIPIDPNLLGDPNESLAPNIIACAVITWVGAAVFVAARFYTRWVIRRVLGWEDWMILAALVFSAGNTAGMLEQAVFGLGKHIWHVKDEHLMPLMRAGWYTILWYVLSLACTKISILLLYLRILTFDWVRNATYAMLAIVALSNIYAVVCTLTACIPIQAWWDFSIKGVCHTQDWWWANTGMHMITDFLIFLLPLPIIFTLRVPMKQKLLLYGIFTFGFFICIISVLRLWMLVTFAEHMDFSYDNIAISYWSCIEINFAIVCACQMTLKPLVSRFFPSLFRDRSSDNNGEQHAVISIGGRPLNILRGGGGSNSGSGSGSGGSGPRKESSSRSTQHRHQQYKRRSWISGTTTAIRIDSDPHIIEDDEHDGVTLTDLESQKGARMAAGGIPNGRGDGIGIAVGFERPPMARAREEKNTPTTTITTITATTTGTTAYESTEQLSELGPEARTNSMTGK